MKEWENRVIELFKCKLSEVVILDTLQSEMKQAGIFAEDHLDKQRIDMAQQIINIVKGK